MMMNPKPKSRAAEVDEAEDGTETMHGFIGDQAVSMGETRMDSRTHATGNCCHESKLH